jgi:hypothetical protein
MSTPKFQIRTVVVRGNTYLRVEDVGSGPAPASTARARSTTEYIRECGYGEETDVRNRLKKAADTLTDQTRQPGT